MEAEQNKKCAREAMSNLPAATDSFALLCKRIRNLERSGDIKKLNTFLDGAEYAAAFAALDAGQKAKVRVLTGKAYVKAEQKLKPIPRYSKRGWRAWDAERIAKLEAAERKHGTDEGIARELGLSLGAARMARWRYIGGRGRKLFVSHATAMREAA